MNEINDHLKMKEKACMQTQQGYKNEQMVGNEEDIVLSIPSSPPVIDTMPTLNSTESEDESKNKRNIITSKKLHKSILKIKNKSNVICKKMIKHSFNSGNNLVSLLRSESENDDCHSVPLTRGREVLLGKSNDDYVLRSRIRNMSTFEVSAVVDSNNINYDHSKCNDDKNNITNKDGSISDTFSQIGGELKPNNTPDINNNNNISLNSTEKVSDSTILTTVSTISNSSSSYSSKKSTNTNAIKRMIYSCSKGVQIIKSMKDIPNESKVIDDNDTSDTKRKKKKEQTNVFLLLMEIHHRKFDIIQVSLPTSSSSNNHHLIKAILNDLISLHTSSTTNKNINSTSIKSQRYVGICRPFNHIDILNSTYQDVYRIIPNEILLPIPDYSHGLECSIASQSIFSNYENSINKILYKLTTNSTGSSIKRKKKRCVENQEMKRNLVDNKENVAVKNVDMKYSPIVSNAEHNCSINENHQAIDRECINNNNKINDDTRGQTIFTNNNQLNNLTLHQEDKTSNHSTILQKLFPLNKRTKRKSYHETRQKHKIKNTVLIFICIATYYNMRRIIVLHLVSSTTFITIFNGSEICLFILLFMWMQNKLLLNTLVGSDMKRNRVRRKILYGTSEN